MEYLGYFVARESIVVYLTNGADIFFGELMKWMLDAKIMRRFAVASAQNIKGVSLILAGCQVFEVD